LASFAKVQAKTMHHKANGPEGSVHAGKTTARVPAHVEEEAGMVVVMEGT